MPTPIAKFRACWQWLLLVIVTCSPAVATAETGATATPLAIVTTTVDGVIAALKDTSVSEDARKRRVKAIIGQHFDFAAMSNRVLATNWRKASKAERAKFIGLFRELLSNTYWQRLAGYSNETVEYLGEKSRGDNLATVNTVIKTASVDIPVDYKLYRRSDGWVAYDIVIEQVSLVRNYRGSFQDIVRAKGSDGLLSELATKVAESSAVAAQ